MSLTLVLGSKTYSSWSMRAWLLLKFLGLPFETVTIGIYTATSRQEVRAHGGQTGLVPVLKDGDLAIWDTPAIFEHLYERHQRVWPADRADRARARSLSGELHSGFSALRAAMPLNTRARGRHAVITPEAQADIDRAAEIWSTYPRGEGWLFGDFCGADIMFAPVATRFQTYGVTLTGAAADYQARSLAHPLVAEWLALGEVETEVIPVLEVG